MPDEGQTGDGAGAGTATDTGAGGDAGAGSSTDTGQSTGQQDAGEDLEGLKSALRKEREDRKALEKQHADAAKRLKEIEDKDKSETEKLTARVAELEKELGEANGKVESVTIGTAITEAAQAAGAIRPDVVAKLIDRSEVKRDDDGKPTNLKDLLAAATKSYPELFQAHGGRGSANGGNTGGAGDDDDMNARIRRAAGRR